MDFFKTPDYINEYMTSAYRVLIVDDDLAQAEMVSEFLRLSGYTDIDHAGDIRAAWRCLDEREYDVMLLDYKLPDGTGLEVLDQLAKRNDPPPAIMVTGQGNERIAVQAIQHGASDYLLKSDGYLVNLPGVIHKAVQSHQLKRSVQRTQEQIRYQAMLLNNVRDAIVVWDLSGRITYWNPAAWSLFGWSPDERLGRPVAQVYINTFDPPIMLPREGEPTSPHVVRRHTNRSGRSLWISSQVIALRSFGQPGRLTGFMDISHDITRRVEAEAALRDSEARYRAIVEDYQTELICRYKPNGALTFANEVYCRYFEKSRDELLGMNILYFIPNGERPRLIQHLGSFSADHPVATLEHQVVLDEQRLRWLQRTDRAIFDEDGRIFEFQSVARDITDRKQLENQIQAAQAQLVQAARMATIGEVASGVAHQIYNPLTTIIADAQLLLRTLPASSSGRDSAEAIHQAGWRLQQVVQRLMEFTRPPGEQPEAIDVNDTIQHALSLVRPSLETIACQVETHLAPDLPPVRANVQQLENLWVNLLLLARDALTLEQRAHRPALIRVTSRLEPQDRVTIEFQDNGKLIPQAEIGTIFEPNFVGATSGRGAGMELSICREIVRQHRGQISAESDPEHDTILRISLPAEV